MNKKTVFIIILSVILAFGAFVLSRNLLSGKKNDGPVAIKKPEQTSHNFLLLGYGGGNHEGTYLTDTMMVVHIDTKIKKVTLFSIPRDLWVRLPTKSGEEFHTKINAVYQTELFPEDYPGLDPKYLGSKDDAKLVKTTVQQITGLTVDGYVSVDFEGFTKAIDILGGIDVDVKRAFTDPEYPVDGKEKDLCDQETEGLFKKAEPFLTPGFNPEERERQFKDDPKLETFVSNATSSPELAFPCRYEKLEFAKGTIHMDGATALKYARSRHSETDGGDFNRALRQQQVIEAVKNKVISLGFVTKIIPLIDEYKKDVKTDIGINLMQKFIKEADNVNEYTITTFVISDENVLDNAISDDKQYILIPKEGMDSWDGVKQTLDFTIKGITPTPEATPSSTLAP
ncbi:MAG: LCP family protein [Patescibacteria group bacterium]